MELRISTDKYLRALLRDREGYKNKMYPDGKDDKGRQLYSAGIGHQLSFEEVERWKGKRIPDEIIEAWFEKDYNNALDDANVLMVKEKIPYSENVFAAMTAASYQMGRTRFGKFKKTFGYLREGDIANAMEEAKNSEWFRGNKEKETKGTPKRVHDFNSLLDPTYDHPEKFELKDTIPFTMNFDTDMYVQRDMIGQDSSVDRLGFVNPNITGEGANARLRGRANLGFSGPMGFVDIGIDDKKNIRGEGGLYTPYGTLTGDTQENYSFQGNPFRVGDANVSLSADNMQGPKLNIDKGALSIEATEDFLRANYKNLSARLTDEEITATYNLNPNVLLSAKYNKDGDYNVGVRGRFRFQEGGEVQDDVGIPPIPPITENPALTSKVLPDAVVESEGFITPRQEVDKTEGFYKYNPAPNESAADFAARMPKEEIVQTKYPPDPNSSFRPPTGYISPRLSNTYKGLNSSNLGNFNYSGGDGSNYSGGLPKKPTTNQLSSSQQAALNLLGTTNDMLASGVFGNENYTAWNTDLISSTINDIVTGMTSKGYDKDGNLQTVSSELDYTKIPNVYNTTDKYDLYSEVYGLDEAFTERTNTILSGQLQKYGVTNLVDFQKEINPATGLAYTQNDAEALLQGSISLAKMDKTLDEIRNTDIFNYTSDSSFDKVLENLYNVDVYTQGNILGGQRTSINLLDEGLDSATPGVNMDLLSSTTYNTIMSPPNTKSFIETLGNTHLGKIGNTSIQMKDIYDEFGATLFTYFITEDTEKALTAGATQFLKTEGVEIFADRAFETAFNLHSPKINAMTTTAEINTYLKAETGIDYNLSGDVTAAKDAANQALAGKASSNFTKIATAAASMVQVLAMGGDTEDAVLAGAESLAIDYGATAIGEAMGAEVTGGFLDATSIGAGTISAIVAFARTGDVGQAAISGATSYLMHVNPVLGFTAMAAQMVFANEMKNYAGYTSLNLEDMSLQSFSHGDVDPNKASPENVKYTAQTMDIILPIIEDIKENYGITKILGDLEIQFGDRDGLYLTITEDKDITGFDNRADFNTEQGDLNRNQVYQKRFNNAEQLQLHVIELFEWAAENMVEDGVLDLATLLQKRKERQNKILLDELSNGYSSVASLMNDPRGGNYTTGGKISLDKGGNVQYNKGNYGLVNKKGKAPPSARADDVPMTLKEGDYVLSQPAVALYGKDTINRMLSRAATKAGKNLKAGGKVPVNVHNGEYIIPKNLTEYIGPNVLETMNNRGLMSVGERPNT